VADSPRFETIAHEVASALKDCVPAAYNAPFDRAFLSNEFARAGHNAAGGERGAPALRREVEWMDPLVWARPGSACLSRRRTERATTRKRPCACSTRSARTRGSHDRTEPLCRSSGGLLRVRQTSDADGGAESAPGRTRRASAPQLWMTSCVNRI
jgi:hypothetical protein